MATNQHPPTETTYPTDRRRRTRPDMGHVWAVAAAAFGFGAILGMTVPADTQLPDPAPVEVTVEIGESASIIRPPVVDPGASSIGKSVSPSFDLGGKS